MNTDDIQNEVNALSRYAVAKGAKSPKVQFMIESDVEFCVMINWRLPTDGEAYSTGEYKFLRHANAEAALEMAREFISEMPSAEEQATRQFMNALSNVIELGKKSGVDIAFINPLQATMKKLSHNIITDQRSIKAKTIDARPLAADDMPF